MSSSLPAKMISVFCIIVWVLFRTTKNISCTVYSVLVYVLSWYNPISSIIAWVLTQTPRNAFRSCYVKRSDLAWILTYGQPAASRTCVYSWLWHLYVKLFSKRCAKRRMIDVTDAYGKTYFSHLSKWANRDTATVQSISVCKIIIIKTNPPTHHRTQTNNNNKKRSTTTH